MIKRLPILLAIILAVAGVGLIYQNHATARHQAVAIESSDNLGTDVTVPQATLKAYAAAHMGAAASVTLNGSYNRAQAAARIAAQSASNASTQVYADAQKACSGKADSLVQAHCNQAYLAAHLPLVPTPATVAAPELAQYQYHYSAPVWTADLAGALLAGGAAAALIALAGWRPRRRLT